MPADIPEVSDWRQWVPIIMLAVAILAFFWFVVLKPVKRRQDEHLQIIDSIENGSRVITAGGLYGTVTRVWDKTVSLKIADNVVITVDRRAIRRMQSEGEK